MFREMKYILTLNLGCFLNGLDHGMNNPGIHQILKADSFKAIPAEIVRMGFSSCDIFGVSDIANIYHIGVIGVIIFSFNIFIIYL